MFKFPYISRPEAEAIALQLSNSLTSDVSSYKIIHFWGVGGVGKTTLTRKLRSDFENQADFSYISFGYTANIENPIKILNTFYEQLPKIPLLQKDILNQKDPFKELYQTYWDTVNELQKIPIEGKKDVTEEQIDLVRRIVSKGASFTASLFDQSGITSAVASKIGETTVDMAKGVLTEKDRLQQVLDSHQATKQNRKLKELMLDPIPKLIQAFLEGIKSRYQRLKKPVVLMFDTYEKASPEITLWLCKVLLNNPEISKSNHLRVVIVGRNNLLKQEEWRRLGQESNFVYVEGLERFDETKTFSYLNQSGITEETIQEQIFTITKGLPYYLNWIREKKEKGEHLDFSQGNQEIVQLLLQGLNNAQKRVIQLASGCRWFNQDILEEVLRTDEGLNFNTCCDDQLNAFQWLVKQDFVEYIQGSYRLDDVARDIFRRDFWGENKQLFQTSHQRLTTYFLQCAKEEVFEDSGYSQKYNNDQWCIYQVESLYHGLYGGKQESLVALISVWFEALYFNQEERVIEMVGFINDEVNLEENKSFLLTVAVKLELKQIILILLSLDQSLDYCFKYFARLSDLAKFNLLLSQSKVIRDHQKLSSLQQAFTLAETLTTAADPEFSSELYLWKLGSRYIELEAYEEAILSYDKAIEFKPDLHEAWNNQGNALVNLGRIEEAILSYDKAIEFKPDLHEAWNNRGNALGNLGRLEEAILSYDKAIEFKPDDHLAWYNRGNALFNLGRLEEAILSYDKAIEFKPDFHEAWNGRGNVLGNLGRHEEAISSYDKAIEFKPDDHLAWYNRGVGLDNLGRYEEAISSYDKAIEFKPDFHEAWNGRGNVLGNLGRHEEAISSYDKAIEFKPDFHEAWYNRGVTLGNLGRYEEGISSYDKAIEFKPDDHEAWYQRGVALAYLKQYQEAIKSYQKALEINPNDAGTYYNIACCYGLQNEVTLAVENLQRAINLDEKYREMAKTESDFDGIREIMNYEL